MGFHWIIFFGMYTNNTNYALFWMQFRVYFVTLATRFKPELWVPNSYIQNMIDELVCMTMPRIFLVYLIAGRIHSYTNLSCNVGHKFVLSQPKVKPPLNVVFRPIVLRCKRPANRMLWLYNANIQVFASYFKLFSISRTKRTPLFAILLHVHVFKFKSEPL